MSEVVILYIVLGFVVIVFLLVFLVLGLRWLEKPPAVNAQWKTSRELTIQSKTDS
jgi:hypothetical protein